jgi:sodium-dependent dicarboxylate transporter 2/3/5
MKLFRQYWAFAFAVIIFFILLFTNPLALSIAGSKVLAIAALMIILWVTEALSMPVVALLPLILFPLLGVAKLEETAAPYASPIIFLFMGGFMIGLAIEKWNLHKRIALSIVKKTGTSGNRIILGFILATGFLSMWLSNTATTMMMYPIAMSVITILELNHKGDGKIRNLSVCLLLSIAYASNFGGIATIIGTPPNVAYVAFLSKHYNGYSLAFSEWMMICTPLAFILMCSLYFVMTRWLFPNKMKASTETAGIISNELSALGKITVPEKRVLGIFITTALLWITKDLINNFQTIVKLDDTMIAVAGALGMFIASSGTGKNQKILEWQDTSKMAWGILLLFGGGITLAGQMEKAGLIEKMGQWLAGFAGSDVLLLVIAVTVISIFISEVMSNVAQVIVFAPVVSSLADTLHINPLLLGLPMTLAASCAGMLPMGTPPNAIVFASGKLKLSDMVKTGFVMNIISIVLITLFSWFLVPMIINAIH